MPARLRVALACAGVLLGLAPAAAASCSTEETPQFGEPPELVNGVGQAPASTSTGSGETTSSVSSSSGPACDPAAACPVSFRADVVPILLANDCATAVCHAPGNETPPELALGDEPGFAASHAALRAYAVEGVGTPYVVPCKPDESAMLCNLKVDGEANPYLADGEDCGSPMPKGTKRVTLAELDTLAKWIECGARDD